MSGQSLTQFREVTYEVFFASLGGIHEEAAKGESSEYPSIRRIQAIKVQRKILEHLSLRCPFLGRDDEESARAILVNSRRFVETVITELDNEQKTFRERYGVYGLNY